MELDNCPIKFRDNCRNFNIKCNCCKANSGGRILQYAPIYSIGDHPASIKNKEAKKYNYLGRKIERKVIESIGAELTKASGAYLGDGDGKLNINGMCLNISHKKRFNNKNTLGPTKKEREEKGIDIWITTSDTDCVVTMDMNTFKTIIGI